MEVSLRKHLILSLALGFAFRVFSLCFVWGPQALDDYLDNLIPAWRHSMGLDPDLHDYRSPLYMWILSFWIKVGAYLHIDSAISQIRWVYFLQAAVSLLAIAGVYLITRKSKNKIVPILSMYLTAVHGLMPFASTRSFMESFVIGLVTMAIALLATEEEDRKKSFSFVVCGFLLLGFASLVRFQIGIIYVSWMLLALAGKNWRQFYFALLFGFVLIIAEAMIDQGFGRPPFGTLRAYFSFNSDQQKSGIMPWYNTWLTWLGVLYFPISFLLWKGWKKAFRKYWKILVPVFLYVLIHSLNPHKEERYLYPIIPLSFIFLAGAWSETIGSRWVRWLYHPFFAVFNTLLLFIGCFINTQVGLVGPLAETQKISDKVLYLDYDKIEMRDYMSPFFVRAPAKKISMEGIPDAKAIAEVFSRHLELEKLSVIDSNSDLSEVFQTLSKKFTCESVKTATSFSDKILFNLKPEKNQRRKPTYYFVCSR
jgi:hypothetical protein